MTEAMTVEKAVTPNVSPDSKLPVQPKKEEKKPIVDRVKAVLTERNIDLVSYTSIGLGILGLAATLILNIPILGLIAWVFLAIGIAGTMFSGVRACFNEQYYDKDGSRLRYSTARC